MRNRELAADYIRRAGIRLRALDVLYEGKSWADVVRESQEIVELALKGLLRSCGIDPPRIHDVSEILAQEGDLLPAELHKEIPRLIGISKEMRRDRELAFYGAEDLTPSDFYSEEDARKAREGARLTVSLVQPHVAATGTSRSQP